ncbi:Ubiquinone biosynthesis protein UbiJ, contains SCP2 domain [Chromobacterium violaceum]|uniref:ubiquinone biosynthesis accessory factor UbiJ n=1 Tax=Chromobacterium violaceum TaxID=536 RepID=UPI0005BCACB3|nr:sterol-binding protein [Chromobacterium violaceum]ATP27742.1 sterol-binding protein [Chromobacterium violaceum]ATP31654.1 sterol-binding protein [Chromobacterium violaceum]MBT2869400.1 sterol-binding protein [Chromobacterium violaceum]MBX9268239.1 sterol-binding protein [Chromobacterium violaceum]OQS49219.1 sterol-binding protein [Chromobacterium violaceum]
MAIQIAAFNHLLNQHPARRAELAAHAGRRVAIALPPLHVAGVITEEGWLAACDGEPEARLKLRHGAVLSHLTGQAPQLSDIALEGDAELASAVGRIVGQLHWHASEDLSRVFGDVAAQRMENLARGLFGFKGQLAFRLADGWIEHLREEAPLLASRHLVQRFVAEVDHLRDDAGRLDKRLERLEAAFNHKQNSQT